MPIGKPTFAVLVLTVGLTASVHGQVDKRADGWRSEAVDLAKYEGWQRIETSDFSFYAPSDLKGGKRRGIDTTVYRYESPSVSILFDIGAMANPRSKREPAMTIMIDGRAAGIWVGQAEAHLHVAYGRGGGDNFNMYVYFPSGASMRDTAEKIFRSLRFNTAPIQ